MKNDQSPAVFNGLGLVITHLFCPVIFFITSVFNTLFLVSLQNCCGSNCLLIRSASTFFKTFETETLNNKFPLLLPISLYENLSLKQFVTLQRGNRVSSEM